MHEDGRQAKGLEDRELAVSPGQGFSESGEVEFHYGKIGCTFDARITTGTQNPPSDLGIH